MLGKLQLCQERRWLLWYAHTFGGVFREHRKALEDNVDYCCQSVQGPATATEVVDGWYRV